MSLIELIIYIALVGTFLMSGVSAAYSMFISVSHDIDQTNSTNSREQGQEQGFVALVSVLTISSVLLLLSVALSDGVGAQYDALIRTGYRISAVGRAYACLDQAFLGLSQDYFYSPRPGGDYVAPFQCRIETISPIDPYTDSSLRNVVATGEYAGIHARAHARVRIEARSISILDEGFILF